jgi:hypothetical protein
MGRIVILGLILSFLVTGALSVGNALAQAERQPTAQDLRNARKLDDTRRILESREWIIYISDPVAKKKAAAETDVLTFKEGKINSQNLEAKGYPESNYTLGFQDEVIYWVTMKTNPEVGQVFLRGEFRDAGMSGTISMRPFKGARTSYTFTVATPTVVTP